MEAKKSRELVVKDNALINASYYLSVTEQRLILLAIVEARKSGRGIDANNALAIHASSYMTQFDVEKHAAYEALKSACKDLFIRQFSFQEVTKDGNVKTTHTHWVSQISYIDNTATVELIFSPAVVPLITRLEKQFTSYELTQVSGLKSRYAIRLYEFLIQWRSVGKIPFVTLADLRRLLGVESGEYSRIEAFKRRALEVAIQQLNEFTDITVKYEQHKAGKVITGFSFAFKFRKQEKPIEKASKEEKNSKNPPRIILQDWKLG